MYWCGNCIVPGAHFFPRESGTLEKHFIIVITVMVHRAVGDSLIFQKQPGKYSLLFSEFQLPMGLSYVCIHTETHWSDMLFVLILVTRLSVLFSHETRRQCSALTEPSHMCILPICFSHGTPFSVKRLKGPRQAMRTSDHPH